MRHTLLPGLMLALVLAAGSGVRHVAAHRALPIAADTATCANQPARFTVQVGQRIAVFSAKRLVVFGTCFAQGASITIWDYAANVSLTNGFVLVPPNANEQVRYTVPNALCNHLLQVVVLDVATNSRAIGNGKTYGPCQPPPPVLKQ